MPGARGLPRWLRVAALVLALVAFDRAMAAFHNPYFSQVLVLVAVNVVLAVSLNLILGFTGQFSLGHAGFFGVGMYVAAATSVHAGAPIQAFLHEGLHLPLLAVRTLFFLLLLGAGGAAAAAAGVVVGLPSLRLQGDYLAIATLGFGEIIRIVILNIQAVGGARGLSVVSSNPAYDVRYEGLFAVYAVTVASILLVARLVYSTRGRAYLAVRDDEIALESLGTSPTRVKTEAFVVGAALAGVAGVLFSQSQGYVHTNSFTFLRSVEAVAFVVLGGMGSITGSILAASALTVAPELLRSVADYRMVAYSLVLIGMMLLRPEGLFGTRELTVGGLRRLFGRSAGVAGTSP